MEANLRFMPALTKPAQIIRRIPRGRIRRGHIRPFQKIIDADAIKISERAQNVRRQHSFAAFIICVCALRNVDRFADLTLCQIGILPQIADAPVSLHVYHQTQYT